MEKNEKASELMTGMIEIYMGGDRKEFMDYCLGHIDAIVSDENAFTLYLTLEEVIFSNARYTKDENYYERVMAAIDQSIKNGTSRVANLNGAVRFTVFMNQIREHREESRNI